jgi:hypothetical protein
MLNPLIGIIASSGGAVATAYESIATTTLGTTATSVTFSSIPATYTHLQIRAIILSNTALNTGLRFNSDSGTNYSWHQLIGSGTAASSYGVATQNSALVGYVGGVASTPEAVVIDVLDYANTSKYKTLRTLEGNDMNGTGYVGLWSGLWQSTSAVTSITLSGTSFTQYSSFALYGIKGA